MAVPCLYKKTLPATVTDTMLSEIFIFTCDDQEPLTGLLLVSITDSYTVAMVIHSLIKIKR